MSSSAAPPSSSPPRGPRPDWTRWIPLRWLSRARLGRRRVPPRDLARRLGRRGERLAARALARQGYRVLAANVRTPFAEVDLLATEGPVLAVVEVKTARAGHGAPPERRLSGRQRRRLVRAAGWLGRRTHPRPAAVRRDLVAVTLGGSRPLVRVHRGWF